MLLAPAALHIPDGFLSTAVALVGWLFAIILIGLALRQTSGQLGERQIPMMGVLAAFIFAAQAINFPVAAGTSGHLLGGALAALVMGPWIGTLIMTAVIVVQGLLFQDGGLLVMGWNIVNMGVITAFTGYAVYSLSLRILGKRHSAYLTGAFIGGWLSVVMGAIVTSFELALSGSSPKELVVPAMTGVHALIGLGEGLITVGAVSLLLMSRPEVIKRAEIAPGRRGANFIAAALLIILLITALSPLASPDPDGLEKVATGQGFLALGEAPQYEIFPDYVIPLIENSALTTILAVLIGTVVVFAIGLLIGRSASRRQGAGD
ncbi:MAG: cobalamin biosynthesis protein CbiM [Anaerolineales bacterium]|nr:cobalamin biosynthesis protein CbiM [Anaerolineales bacterium]